MFNLPSGIDNQWINIDRNVTFDEEGNPKYP